jgi:hypothetical protein
MASPLAKQILLAVTGVALVACVAWALLEPGWSSATATLSALVAMLGVLGDSELTSRLGRITLWKDRRASRRLRRKLKKRHQRQPDQVLTFAVPGAPEEEHEVALYLLEDMSGSGLIKAIVHHAPSADPYDVITLEGAKPDVKVLDLDADGRPELLVDTVVGAHTHQVNVFCLNSLNRFQEAERSPLFADWGPVELARADRSPEYQITVLRGSGAAGSDAKPATYRLSDGTLELVESSNE